MKRIYGKAREPRRSGGMRAFESRTEVWREAGLGAEISRGDARKARREAIMLLILIVGVIVVFTQRDTLLPDAGKGLRYVTAVIIALLGWLLARTLSQSFQPALFRRLEPGTAGTVGFLIRLGTIFVVVIAALRIAGVKPETLAVGGAFTAVVLGLAAQQTLAHVFAGLVLLTTRPFVVGDRVKLRGGSMAGEVDGIVRLARALLHDARDRRRSDHDPQQRADAARRDPDLRARAGRAARPLQRRRDPAQAGADDREGGVGPAPQPARGPPRGARRRPGHGHDHRRAAEPGRRLEARDRRPRRGPRQRSRRQARRL